MEKGKCRSETAIVVTSLASTICNHITVCTLMILHRDTSAVVTAFFGIRDSRNQIPLRHEGSSSMPHLGSTCQSLGWPPVFIRHPLHEIHQGMPLSTWLGDIGSARLEG